MGQSHVFGRWSLDKVVEPHVPAQHEVQVPVLRVLALVVRKRLSRAQISLPRVCDQRAGALDGFFAAAAAATTPMALQH